MGFFGFDIYITKGYGPRPKGHRAVYQMEPRWYFIEVGDWTIEVVVPAIFENTPRKKEVTEP